MSLVSRLSLLASLLCSITPALALNPHATMDIQADIAQPTRTEDLDGGIDSTKASGRVLVYRTNKAERRGIIIHGDGFGDNEPGTESTPMPEAFVDENEGSTTDPDFVYAREELGYDIYELDWFEGTTYMQKNAMVMVKLIELIHSGGVINDNLGDESEGPPEPEPALGPDEKLVILAPSMSGVVSRFALAYMEHRADLGEGIDHGVDLWMTMDTPHRGAYIPIGLQYMANYLNSVSLGVAAEEQLRDINSPAAKQLLLLHYQEADDPDTPFNHEMRDWFLQELAEYGDYPSDPGLRSVAWTNGIGTGENSAEEAAGFRKFDLPKEEPRLIEGRYTTGRIEEWITEVLWGGKRFGIPKVPTVLELGAIIEVWATRPNVDNPLVFRSQFGTFLYIDGKRVDLSLEAIKNGYRKAFNLPKFIPDWVLDRTVNTEANNTWNRVKRELALISPDSGSARVDTSGFDYSFEWIPGGLQERAKDAASAIAASSFVQKTTFIPAVSGVGFVGALNTPIQDIDAGDTPFDRIGYERGDDNRTHLTYGEKKTKNAYAFFRDEITNLLDTPTIFETSPSDTPEGSALKLITVRGSDFTDATEVLWNGTARTTTFVSENELRVSINESDVASIQEAVITLSDPISEFTSFLEKPFDVVPVDITVTPSNYGPGDSVRFAYTGLSIDSNLPADPVVSISGNTIQVTATKPSGPAFFGFRPYKLQVPLGRLDPGSYNLIYRVDRDGSIQTIQEEVLSLNVPAPEIDSVNPESVATVGAATTLELSGSGFFTGSSVDEAFRTQAFWNGEPIPATALNRELLKVEVPGDAEMLGLNTLEILNPEPGGGTATIQVPYTGPLVTSAVRSFRKSTEGLIQRIAIKGQNLDDPVKVLWNGVESDFIPLRDDRSGNDIWLDLTVDQSAAQGIGSLVIETADGASTPVIGVAQIPPPNVLMVMAGTGDGDDGESWETAFDRLDTALAAASSGQEIWVANGTYESSFFGPSTGFQMVEGVAVLGGFAGGETASNQRNPDPATNNTVLTGDRLGDDGNFGVGSDNAKHVIQGTGLTATTILDGFTIRAGNGSMELLADENQGGGIKLVNSSPVLRNLIIEGNRAALGGGLYSIGGSPSLEDVTLRENLGTFGGGALFLGGSSELNRLCVFGNEAFDGGGLRFESNSTADLTNSLVVGNVASNGAGIDVSGSSPHLSYVTISGNEASASGGGIRNSGSPLLNQTIIWGNTALLGPGIAGVPVDPASADNTIEGGHSAGSNINESDPLFVRRPDSGADGLWYPDRGDNDKGNLRLFAGSPAEGQGAYEGVFNSFAALYPDLEETEDANQDGLSNFLAYMLGQDPEGPPSTALSNQFDLTAEGMFLDVISARPDDAAFEFQSELSADLQTWYPLNESLGLDLEIESSEDLPNGVTRIRVRLLTDPEVLGSLFLRTGANPRSPTSGLRSEP